MLCACWDWSQRKIKPTIWWFRYCLSLCVASWLLAAGMFSCNPSVVMKHYYVFNKMDCVINILTGPWFVLNCA